MNQPKQISGAWIFLSHSHKDLEKVRFIRNELEHWGHNPLIFFLKCLEDDNAELPDLIRREIVARQWFILCNSPNAEASSWVQEEVKIIQSMEDKKFVIVDLNTDLESQILKIAGLCKRATVFLSYSFSDQHIAKRIVEYLSNADFSVWNIEPLMPGCNWAYEITNTLNDAIQNGFVLLLLSESSLKSKFWQLEALFALEQADASKRSNVIPVIISPFDRSGLPPELNAIQGFDLTLGSFNESMNKLIREMKNREME